jgi:hypothetical protein
MMNYPTMTPRGLVFILDEAIDRVSLRLTELRRDIHRNPALSNRELPPQLKRSRWAN